MRFWKTTWEIRCMYKRWETFLWIWNRKTNWNGEKRRKFSWSGQFKKDYVSVFYGRLINRNFFDHLRLETFVNSESTFSPFFLKISVFSQAIFSDSKALIVQLLFPLLPLLSVQPLQTSISQRAQLFVRLLQLLLYLLFVLRVALTHRVLIIRLVPLCVAPNGLQLAHILLLVPFGVLSRAALHNVRVSFCPRWLLLNLLLHSFVFFVFWWCVKEVLILWNKSASGVSDY